jgi:lipooligosaccharide transport system permease protein
VRWLIAAVEWQSRAVVRRHAKVYLGNWHIAFVPPALEPVMMLFAFGVGLGGYVGSIEWGGQEMPYLTYVAPGLLTYAGFMTPMFQGLYAAFIRMRYQRTWEGQLTTQIELPHVVWGEVLWAGLLGTVYVAIVSAVIVVFQLFGLVDIRITALPFVLPIALVAGCAFAALGLLFTATMPTIDHMNLPVFLLVLPLGVLSATYFPIPPGVYALLSQMNPVYHLAETMRSLVLVGRVDVHLPVLAAFVLVMLGVLVPLDLRLLRRRVLGD